jgi:gamma-glutamyltranspeptidase/glutathione hydrolase
MKSYRKKFEWFTDQRMLQRESVREDASFWEGISTRGIVTTAHYRATEVGAQILAEGGNAIDAAIAVSVALGVVEPSGSSLGGMAMMMIYLAKDQRTFILEGPCRAPKKATPELVAAAPRKFGYKAVAVPTNPAVLGYALKHYGTLSIQQILEPVYHLAKDGFSITPFQSRIRKEYLSSICEGNAAPFLLTEEYQPPPPGTYMKQPVLADTIKRLAKAGFEDFYQGKIGKRILADMAENHGFISEQDFQEIPWPKETEPLSGQFHSWTIVSMPPPGGGITLMEMLNLFEALEPASFDPDSPEAAVLFTRIIQKVRLDRRKYTFIPLDLSQWTGPDLLSKSYAKSIAQKLQEKSGNGETTHFNVIDRDGNIVALTQSIERSFGAKVATQDLGFLYNGFMKGFKIKIESVCHPHYLRSGAIARSNAAPTLVFEEGKPKYAIGSTGSERMVSSIFQVLVRLYKQQSPFEAVKAPRLHCNPEGQVFLEVGRFSPQAIALLKKHGFEVIPYDSSWAFSSGGLQLAMINEEYYIGVADPRRDGAAAGPMPRYP